MSKLTIGSRGNYDEKLGDKIKNYILKERRSVESVKTSVKTIEGEGIRISRSFPTPTLTYVDPFLLLDEFGPQYVSAGETTGLPAHPHRGFETVTYMLEGKFEHKDSRGNSGKLSAGDVQWMTAGAGLVHSEMPEKEFVKAGGSLHGFQLWVNLPKADKMIQPLYQEIPSARIPTSITADEKVLVKVIAGESLGARAVINTRTPITYLHFTVQQGSEIVQPIPSSYNAFCYVIDGDGLFGDDRIEAGRGQIIIFNKDGMKISVGSANNSKSPLELLLIAGIPLNETVARYGPFVMNTNEEIKQAIEDYQNGKLGTIEF
jgi:redox-sensitive bicupin YhaK (pirin superfamily)